MGRDRLVVQALVAFGEGEDERLVFGGCLDGHAGLQVC